MATLYITEPGSRLEKEYQRLRVVDQEGKSLLVTPLARVSEVVLVGQVGATTPAMLALLDEGINLTFLTRQGKLRGRLTPPTGKNLALRQRQYGRAGEPLFCQAVSRAIVAGKLRNSRTMARRMLRAGAEPPPGQLDRLAACLKAVTHASSDTEVAGPDTPDSSKNRKSKIVNRSQRPPVGKSEIVNHKPDLMGQEGAGAKAYFAIFRAALREGLEFGERSRRPPLDPVNGLLSLGYSLLAANLSSALEVVGLDPYCGFFHGQAAYGRPGLALDLMEEFRPVVVDSVVLSLVNKRMLSKDDFEVGPQAGIYLTRRGRRIFFEQYTRRLNSQVFHPLAGRALSYQKIFEIQARQMAKLIMGEVEAYQPFLVK